MTSEKNTQVNQWLDKETEEVNKQTNFDGEKLPALKFEEGKVITFKVDFSEPFGVYDDQENKAIKAIIPVVQNGEKKVLWLNKKNPLYKEIILAGKNGQVDFKVLQTGSKANTKYNLIKE